METIEDIILRNSGRGMDRLRPLLPEDFCHRAARRLLDLPRGTVLLTTGFFVTSAVETDGPAGTFAVSVALRMLGFSPVIVTDSFCRGIFEQEQIPAIYFPMDATPDDAVRLLQEQQPVALFSLERCGLNLIGDYCNMRGRSIRDRTAPIDLLFFAAQGKIPTVCVGDGGNEIGMGNVAGEIARSLPLNPCIVPCDELVIATVSNWGGYGICAALEQLTGRSLTPSYEEILLFLQRGQALGCVDGITGLPAITEDGFPTSVTEEILDALKKAAREHGTSDGSSHGI